MTAKHTYVHYKGLSARILKGESASEARENLMEEYYYQEQINERDAEDDYDEYLDRLEYLERLKRFEDSNNKQFQEFDEAAGAPDYSADSQKTAAVVTPDNSAPATKSATVAPTTK